MSIILFKESFRGAPPVTHNSLEWASVFISALINPLFLTYVIVSPFRAAGRSFRFYRVAVPSMIPFCWVIFHYQNYRAREGHYLWTAVCSSRCLSGCHG